MAKSYAQFICQDCGYTNPRYLGRCPNCGNWDTLIEERIEKSIDSSTASYSRFNATSVPRPIQNILSDEEKRIRLKHEEFSRVLGGGIVPGSINLIGGDPGIGKSTLLLQIALELAENIKVLYVSGEESERQIKMRADRLYRDRDGNPKELPGNLFLVTETNLEAILDHTGEIKPSLLIVDSIQTSYLPQLESS
ncbi:MAG: AAA family ATPase, partial [Anaerolineales bacterium]|nr:AAA family ATPase [Anaerolineales bacterium]